MIISSDFVFVHLQKTGGSFVEKFLLKNYNNAYSVKPKHTGIYVLKSKVGKRMLLDSMIKFGCIRNPFDWYVSWWSANSKDGCGLLFPKIFKGERRKSFKKFMFYIMNKDFGRQHDLEGSITQNRDIGIYTYRYLKSFSDPFTDEILVDSIIHTENMIEELKNLFVLKGKVLSDLENMDKVHTSKHKDYREYYDDELIDLVKHKDEIIIKRFNYEF